MEQAATTTTILPEITESILERGFGLVVDGTVFADFLKVEGLKFTTIRLYSNAFIQSWGSDRIELNLPAQHYHQPLTPGQLDQLENL